MGSILAILARPLIEAAVLAFGQILLEFMRSWRAQADARELGRIEVERAAAIEAARVAEDMAGVPEPELADLIRRLEKGGA